MASDHHKPPQGSGSSPDTTEDEALGGSPGDQGHRPRAQQVLRPHEAQPGAPAPSPDLGCRRRTEETLRPPSDQLAETSQEHVGWVCPVAPPFCPVRASPERPCPLLQAGLSSELPLQPCPVPPEVQVAMGTGLWGVRCLAVLSVGRDHVCGDSGVRDPLSTASRVVVSGASLLPLLSAVSETFFVKI